MAIKMHVYGTHVCMIQTNADFIFQKLIVFDSCWLQIARIAKQLLPPVELLCQFWPNFAQSIFGWRGFIVCSNEEPFNSQIVNNGFFPL